MPMEMRTLLRQVSSDTDLDRDISTTSKIF